MRGLMLVAAMAVGAVAGGMAWPSLQTYWQATDMKAADLRLLRSEASSLRAQQAAQWAQIEVLLRTVEELRTAQRVEAGRPSRDVQADAAAARAAETRLMQLEARSKDLEQRLASLQATAQAQESLVTRAQGAALVLADRVAALERTVRDRLPALERTAEDRMLVLERSLSDRIATLERRPAGASPATGNFAETIDQLRDEIGEIREQIALLRR